MEEDNGGGKRAGHDGGEQQYEDVQDVKEAEEIDTRSVTDVTIVSDSSATSTLEMRAYW
jgi:hypothetical protein